MKTILTLCFLLIYSTAFAGVTDQLLAVIAAKNVASGLLCSSGTLDVSQTAGTDSTSVVDDAKGQSFKVTDGSYIYSIEFELSGTRTCEFRWGDSADLTSGYFGRITGISTTTQAYYEAVFADTVNQTSGATTYYGLLLCDGVITLYRDDSSPSYADGTYRFGTGWNASSEAASIDTNFKVNICAD